MNRALIAAALLAGSALLPATASANDPRLVERLYDETKVVRIEGKPNVQAAIRFEEDEHIENVAIGDSTAWQVTPNKRANMLFVKPLADRASTNMTVVTDQRTYLFDLVANPASRNPVYVLSFTYPKDPEEVQLAEAEGVAPAAPNAMEIAAATDPYAVVDPASLNYAWGKKGDATLFPAEIYDDGNATFLIWAPGATLPAILVTDHEGTEGPVNFAVRGDAIVVDGVPGRIVLRSGDNEAELANQGPARPARQPSPGPGLARANGPAATEVK